MLLYLTAENLAKKFEDFILNKYYFNKEMIATNAASKFNNTLIGKQFLEFYAGL